MVGYRSWFRHIVVIVLATPILSTAHTTLISFSVQPSAAEPPQCNPAPQTWTAFSGPGTTTVLPFLLTDGTVMVNDGNVNWWILTPDLYGCYANGNWKPVTAPMPAGYSPSDFASAILPDGRVAIAGGEYNNNIHFDTNLGAIYDPVVNQWAPISPPATGTVVWPNIGDAASVILPNGTFMVSGIQSYSSPMGLIFLNPTSYSWTTAMTTTKTEVSTEEGWTLLPNGSVLDVDIYLNQSDTYNPSTNIWTQTAIPVPLGDTNCEESGPAILRPNGTVLALGATGNTAIYSTSTNTWSAGPVIPNGLVVTDGEAAILPNGNVFFAATPPQPSPTCFGTNPQFFEFDGVTPFIPRSQPPDPYISHYFTQGIHMLVLPTGQLFVSMGSSNLQEYLYTAAGTYLNAWRPTITNVPAVLVRGHASYAIQGKQFNGMTQATSFGDEYQNATNYPLARITNSHSGHVRYVRTHAFSSMGVATGSAIVSAQFDIPTNIEIGASTFEVVANGIPSVAVNVNVECTADGIFCDGFEQIVW